MKELSKITLTLMQVKPDIKAEVKRLIDGTDILIIEDDLEIVPMSSGVYQINIRDIRTNKNFGYANSLQELISTVIVFLNREKIEPFNLVDYANNLLRLNAELSIQKAAEA